MSQAKLRAKIIELSQATEWEEARDEWRLQSIWMNDDAQACECGHFPIHEICVIRNRRNGNTTEVGNHCVNNFLEINSEIVFASVRKVVADGSASFNRETIRLAFDENYINEWERDFYLRIWRKQKLSYKQLNIKHEINRKVLRRMRR